MPLSEMLLYIFKEMEILGIFDDFLFEKIKNPTLIPSILFIAMYIPGVFSSKDDTEADKIIPRAEGMPSLGERRGRQHPLFPGATPDSSHRTNFKGDSNWVIIDHSDSQSASLSVLASNFKTQNKK